ncbi:3-dehydroquinate synthase [Flavobacterium sp. MK4S-17]|uniref:3-dehydroquinate synthase n=1 Tax=Flavobacterium sp. MK4S-17 TaxID=2543737 RepID=UPI00135776AC|nr:3-dehydroquinate synthase [Flavobacterium sp. MK4S-17]
MKAIITPNYPIYFNEECYNFLQDTVTPENYSVVFIIADSNTAQMCLPVFLEQFATEVTIEIIEVEPGEHNKNIETCIQVWYALTELGADRRSLIINLGGGLVTDMGGFIASTFKRGIDFINVPTSLLAMVDASVGGKTGIDLGTLKNQVGVINNPIAVLTDILFLETLPANQLRSGFAEMFKHGLIYSSSYWDEVVSLSNLVTGDLLQSIHTSITIKNDIVQQDPTEKNVRRLLNFGHTLGHAIESYFMDNENKHPVLHGEAVAAGMVMEAYIAMEKRLLDEEEYLKIKSVLQNVFDVIDFTETDIENIIELLIHDKKNEFGNIMFVLLNGIGKAIINQPVENPLIYNAFQDYLN